MRNRKMLKLWRYLFGRELLTQVSKKNQIEKVTGFFDNTGFAANKTIRNRSNERYERIIRQNLSHITGKNILDLASHQGMWSWAALESGANYVLGVEGRNDLIQAGLPNFSEVSPERYKFICRDVFDALENLETENSVRFSTIFCLGIFYHIMDHYRLVKLMTDLRPEAIILDTGLLRSEELLIQLDFESTDEIANAIPEHKLQKRRLVGLASIGAMKAMVSSCGYVANEIKWRQDETGNTDGLSDYFHSGPRARFTYVLTPRSGD